MNSTTAPDLIPTTPLVVATAAPPQVWRLPLSALLGLLLIGVVVAVGYPDAVEFLIGQWNREEYSHAPLIPLISLGLLYLVKDRLELVAFEGSSLGAVVVVIGAFLMFLGKVATVHTVSHYAFVLAVVGLALALGGRSGWKYLWVPAAFLFFMIPLPSFLYNNLSQKLQLLSSEIGVAVIRWFGITVFLEGNVIDLGAFKLQVVEACSGLRYLFPLMSFGFLCAYLFSAPAWQRAVIFLSTIPITVLMNSFRIGVIGVTVDLWGQEMAEGFLHDFEGWVIFMACVGVLILEMLVLMKLTGDRRPLAEAFGVELPAPTPDAAVVNLRSVPFAFWVGVGAFVVTSAASLAISQRAEPVIEREPLATFPMEVDGWQGERGRIEQIYLDQLQLDDYIIADYRSESGDGVNFYVAWYNNQRAGHSAHSPRSCLPGGGWVINSLTQVVVPEVAVNGHPLKVNRVQIQMGENRQLVYYWFQQRGRDITNEYLVKWWLFWDSLTRNRSDGALIRMVTSVPEGQDWSEADERLARFAKSVEGKLERSVPN
jgi:exosortase D (VPLPA-CTERM-specific)